MRGGVIAKVSFENLLINGQPVQNAKQGKITIGENVTGVMFAPGATLSGSRDEAARSPQ